MCACACVKFVFWVVRRGERKIEKNYTEPNYSMFLLKHHVEELAVCMGYL